MYDNLERVDHRALVYEIEGRRRLGLTNDRAVALVDEWIDRVVQATVDDRVGEYVRRAADRLSR